MFNSESRTDSCGISFWLTKLSQKIEENRQKKNQRVPLSKVVVQVGIELVFAKSRNGTICHTPVFGLRRIPLCEPCFTFFRFGPRVMVFLYRGFAQTGFW